MKSRRRFGCLAMAALPVTWRPEVNSGLFKLAHYPGLLLFVRFAHDRRFVGLVFVVFVLVIIIVITVVGVSRRHRVDHDGDAAPVDQPSGRVLGDARGHVGSCWMSRHSRADVSAL